MISFSSISKKFKFWPRKDSQRKEKERGKLTKKVEKKSKNQNHPALIGMKWKKRTLFDEKHQVKNKTNTTKKKFMALFWPKSKCAIISKRRSLIQECFLTNFNWINLLNYGLLLIHKKSFKETFTTKNYNNVQNEKKQKQTKNRAKINEKNTHEKKDHLPYTNIVGKKKIKKSQME